MAVHDFKSQRLFVEFALGQDKSFEASREQANYLLNVLRMQDGDKILVFNGVDGEWLAEIEAKGRKKCALFCISQTREQPKPLPLIYCFAPLKQGRLDYMVQKAVEMGAGVLQPVITQYTQARQIKHNKLYANMIEAVEQCGILTLPEIREPVDLHELPKALGEDVHLIFCDEEANQKNATESFKSLAPLKPALLIGPEGGFSDDERSFLYTQENITALGLGPRILRADTAAVAALAIIQANIGDWYQD